MKPDKIWRNDEWMLGAPLLLDANVSEENSNALLEEYFLQKAIAEHQNIVKFLLCGLFKGNLRNWQVPVEC